MREGLYRALSATGNPEFSTVMKVIKTMKIKLHTAPAVAAKPCRVAHKKVGKELAVV